MGGGDYDGDKANLNAYFPFVSALADTAYDAGLIANLQGGAADDAYKLEELVQQGRVRRSTSTLGCLFDGVDICDLLEEWHRYGPYHYRFEEVRKNGGVEPNPRLALTPDSMQCLGFASGVLERYLEKSMRIMSLKGH